MRPLPGDGAFGRQRSNHAEGQTPASSSSNNHMSFCIADEATVDSYLDQPSIATSRVKDQRKAAEAARVLSVGRDDQPVESSRPASRQHDYQVASTGSSVSRATNLSPSPLPLKGRREQSLSRPVTPITLGTSCGSAMSSPSSRWNSLNGSISEHAVSWDGDEEEEEGNGDQEDATPLQPPAGMIGSGSAPQLVMPSIKMPSRRPFTESGKMLGRVKLLVAGKSGVGKTSLIKAIVQSCEHIVHIDPIVSDSASSRRSSKATARPIASRRSSDTIEQIREVYASTKPYPEWWSELDDFRSSQRRKSLGDQILERNICFVDTPGYNNKSSVIETITPCIDYVESHLNRMASDSLSEPEMLSMLGGGGGFQVDAVLYLIQRSLCPADIEYLKRLGAMTNIIPLLAQADLLSQEERKTCKQRISEQLLEAGIRSFHFFSWPSSVSHGQGPTIPYAVSSAAGCDYDIMDASLLMSPDYVQPLLSTELSSLVGQIFSPNGSSWLRHSAVQKYLQWRSNPNPSRPRHLYRPLSVQGPSPPFMPGYGVGALIGRGSRTVARVHDLGHDDGLPRLHLSDWAADLQRSLASERAQFEALARGDRAVWLTEKLQECVKDGTLVPVTSTKETVVTRRKKGPQLGSIPGHQDPLGLLQVAADLKAKGWFALELMGSLGILGGLAIWLARHRWHVEPLQMADEWARMWGMDI